MQGAVRIPDAEEIIASVSCFMCATRVKFLAHSCTFLLGGTSLQHIFKTVEEPTAFPCECKLPWKRYNIFRRKSEEVQWEAHLLVGFQNRAAPVVLLPGLLHLFGPLRVLAAHVCRHPTALNNSNKQTCERTKEMPPPPSPPTEEPSPQP